MKQIANDITDIKEELFRYKEVRSGSGHYRLDTESTLASLVEEVAQLRERVNELEASNYRARLVK